MTRNRRKIAELRDQIGILAVRAASAERALREERAAHKAELDAMSLRAATAEAKAIRLPGVCPDRATCLRNTSAAEMRHHRCTEDGDS